MFQFESGLRAKIFLFSNMVILVKRISVILYWCFLEANTVEFLISWQSRDSIFTVLCHSVRFKRPNDQCGATVEMESRDCQDMRESTVMLSPKKSFPIFPITFTLEYWIRSLQSKIQSYIIWKKLFQKTWFYWIVKLQFSIGLMWCFRFFIW